MGTANFAALRQAKTIEPLIRSHPQQSNKSGKALPPLQEYYGEPEKLDAWLQQAQVRIQIDYSNCSELVKFWALSACLRGEALERMDAWTREYGTEDQATVRIFFDQMRFVFQDPQSKERAQRKLESLRQGNRSFLDTYMEWQGLIIEAGGAS
ncbi:hypothetical protein M501DRAFT_1056361 [Patellaria atrata CBS 101060]|uniref:Retrotransposon gag domain-containing protein n=1 Tax=Patellaria atrata CBS 101060 TaxID=1346257 RepID=A0A9P4SE40_9PEZI|nr:hypothetical protein M501DRAFT_1056361 [Patellaria atrata CBS 101060]